MTLNDDLSADRYATLSDEPAQQEIVRLRSALECVGRSEQEFADTFENGVLAIHWVGPDGTILRANQAELNLLGYTHTEYVGRNIADFHCDAPVIEDLLARLDGGEVVRNFSARLRRKDGSVKHVLIDSSAYREGDRFIHARCFTRDVSAEVAAQERWHLAAAATGDLIWDWNILAEDVTWTGTVEPYFSRGAGSNPVSDYHAWAERV